MKRKFIAALLLVCVLAGLIPAELSALAASQTVYVTANTLPVYKTYSTSSKVLGTMSYGESMTLLATNSSWAYVKNSSGSTGYCKLSGIGTSNPNKYDEKIYINSSNVKVYKKPDTSSSVMMTLSKNASYTAVARTSDNEWARLKNGSAYGYVQMKYISTSKVDDDAPSTPDLTSKTVFISANTLNAYKSASTSSKVLGVMSYGESMTLLATSGDWAQIRNSANAVGYCKLSGLTATNPNNLDVRVYVSSASAKVYKKPTTSAGVLTTAKQNDSFTAVAITADSAWARVKSGSSYGYIQASSLSASETEPEEPDEPEKPLVSTVYISANTLVAYSSPSTSSKNLGTMSYGESMTLLDVDGSWAKIQNSAGAVGYCKLSGLTTENPNTLNTTIYITETGAKLYAKPTTSATVLGTLKQNAKYTAVAMTTDKVWLRLKNGSSYGYLLTDYASTEEVDDPTPGVTGTVYISANTLVAYSSPSTSSKSLGTMSYGESMLLLGVDDGWAKIQNSSGAVGYCKFGGLTNVNPNNLNLTMYAQSNGVKLYAKPLTTATVSKTINQGDSVTVIAVTGDGAWARVNLGSGKYAYVQTKYISETKPDGDDSGITDIKKKTVYISATTLAVYASPSTSSASLGTMSFGESLSCTGVNSTWARVVNSSGALGYCKLSGLSDTNPNTYNVTLYTQSSGVKVYAKASTSSTVLTTLSLNAKVTGVAINADKTWIRLKNDSGTYGYVQAGSVATTPDNGSSATVNKVIALAKAQSGKPYVYGTTGPNSFDCSGFTYYVFKNAAGVTLKRTSESQGYDSSYTKISAISDLKVGDLVFFNTNSDDADLCDHVGIYLGSGSFIHASSAGGKVITSSLNSGYYNRTYSWGRRVL
ncbi:MAG: SH3 domain-containing protein [Clostridia bacterium]|nr:SH3 domain-containing protein [Clostridia bacterium]